MNTQYWHYEALKTIVEEWDNLTDEFKYNSIKKLIDNQELRENKEQDSISIPVSLFKDIYRCFNMIRNTKVSGLTHGKDSYDIASILGRMEVKEC
jgi:hypothetical protein